VVHFLDSLGRLPVTVLIMPSLGAAILEPFAHPLLVLGMFWVVQGFSSWLGTPPAPWPLLVPPTFAARPGAGDNHRAWPVLGLRPACVWPQPLDDYSEVRLIRRGRWSRRSLRFRRADHAQSGPAGQLAICASGRPRPAVAHAVQIVARSGMAAPDWLPQSASELGGELCCGRLLMAGLLLGPLGESCLWPAHPSPLDGTLPTLQRRCCVRLQVRGRTGTFEHTLK